MNGPKNKNRSKAVASTLVKLLIGIVLIPFPSAIAAQNKASEQAGTLKHPIIDARMTEKEAFDGLDPKCPAEIRKRQRLIALKYYSFDKRVHQGQLVLDKSLTRDVKTVFKAALELQFPIYSVIPISDMRFRKNGRWDDNLSMAANNTSAFNYRLVTGGTTLSNHATGTAVDINTVQNPYIKGTILLPPNGKYDPGAIGTFTPDHPLVKLFEKLGWTWGGTWKSPIDYQHFEKPRKVQPK